MKVDLDQLFQIYDLLKEQYIPEQARNLITAHAGRNCIVTSRSEAGEVIGAAFFWHIADPWDVVEKNGFPGEDPEGNYLYFPMIFIKPSHRGGTKILWELIYKAFQRNHWQASRMAFSRSEPKEGRIKILRIRNNGKSSTRNGRPADTIRDNAARAAV